ncbi:short-chain fatty acyl-CoA regulator family protein (plasmid) [Brucella intermedia]|uniref:short-chain fatty acyl-CoA regulator family protein n=1 Tax=Brucella intermedia TaxID=94625 RepID=UPI00273579BE|nr:short-chain fatty acyl-CoA regulator family protein [Brucella intermedia]WLF99644.1 short-chain fatty acyl-CoA regulator family protein [Brucella intermedia]
MKKPFVGLRLKRLREERQLTQQALANALGISLSYLNQIENNQRPITVQVLLRMNAAFGIDVQLFSGQDDGRMIGELRQVFSNPLLGETVSNSEIREIASNMPAVGRTVLQLYKQMRKAIEQSEALAMRLGDPRQSSLEPFPSMPYEEVRDYFYGRSNHIAELDLCAEKLAGELGMQIGRFDQALAERLHILHSVSVKYDQSLDYQSSLRRFDPASRTLMLSNTLSLGQSAFQMATQLCFLEQAELLDTLTGKAGFSSSEAVALARIGLANYFAGALILPYRAFLQSAEQLHYDIDLLGQRFGVGFETICHRLSTLQRPGAIGVPFFFVRVDRAGNISKRQSATDFHFSRIGGSCPLWTVYDAFSSPGRVCTQIAEMPDGRAYLWVARTVTHHHGGYGAPDKTFAIGLGCDLRDAERLVYSKGLVLNDLSARTMIGVGCKLCERRECSQRAFPPISHEMQISDNVAAISPYAAN